MSVDEKSRHQRPAGTDAEAPGTGGSPWRWIPSLYIAQGIPYVVVMTLSVVMYKRLGVSNTDIALYTSLLYLPWVLKPLWSPVVDILKTKRLWIVVMQLLIALALAGVGLAVQSTTFFALSLAIFWIVAFSSATHDIAADGFYMLSLSKRDQAWFVGIRSTFYRLAMIVGSGLLIMFAGVMETRNGLPPVEVTIEARPGATNATFSEPLNPIKPVLSDSPGITASPSMLVIGTGQANKADVETTLAKAHQWNLEHGFYPAKQAPAISTSFWSQHIGNPVDLFWKEHVSGPLAGFLHQRFPQPSVSNPTTVGKVTTTLLWLQTQPSRPTPINISPKPEGMARIGIGSSDKGFKVIEGERIVFTPGNWTEPAMVVIQVDPKISQPIRATFVTRAGNIPLAWSLTLFLLAVIFFAFCVWHRFVLPRPITDTPVRSGRGLTQEFAHTLGSFFRKPGILTALGFILLYRFAEAQSVKLLTPFLLDPREAGGLGLTTGQVGFVYGTIGVAALTLGGLLGGFLGAKYGLKRMMPFMVCTIHLPNLAFVYLSFAQPENLLSINTCIALEQFGYGFGFTAYMLYLLHFSDGEHKTAHYAICTGLMALGMMLPGLFSGWLQEILGYKQFFVWVMLATIPGFLVAFLVRLEQPKASPK